MKFNEIFGVKKPIIGALHFAPTNEYFFGSGATKARILDNAIHDLEAFVNGGVDGVIIENNYDLPHEINVDLKTYRMMVDLGCELRGRTEIPFGTSVLWNDYRAAITISGFTQAKFIRVPVFVDAVKTDFGEIYGNPKDVKLYRQCAALEDDVALFTDIQVKHAEMLDKTKSIEQSVQQAIEAGSDCLILTGRWTGEAPDMEKLKRARAAAGNFPIILGSGVTKSNVAELFQYANGAIVSTSLKEGEKVAGERNVKPYDYRISEIRVREFMQEVGLIRQTLINNNPKGAV